ncbi:MAG: signal peptidase I, partial [Candidatus Magasanikbacteria bacterium]|nr:signal peptidase I [Candidatus Magasanikbacteria bacterium]
MSEKEQDKQDNIVVGEREKSFLASAGLFFLELIKIAILAGVTIGLVRYFLFKPFYVRGQSMEPNFFEKDYLIIDELSYRFREPERGEVVVFKAQNGSKDYYLKRIVGLPGERVKIGGDKVVIYNNEFPQGTVLPEELYLNAETYGAVDLTLGSGQYFVMGDNRGSSYDSRRFGPVSKDDIVGRAWLRGWPFT